MASLFRTMDSPAGGNFRQGDNPIVSAWRQRGLFAIVFIVTLGIAIAALMLLPHRYFTSGSLIVAEPESGLSLPPAGWAQKVGDPADVESQLLVIRSARVLRSVLALPGVMDTIHAECEANRNPIMDLFSNFHCSDLTQDNPASIDYLQSRYTVGGAGRSRVITIGYTSSDPATAQSMANALINVFLQDHRDGISSGRAVAIRSLGDEIARLDGEIRGDDKKIQMFRAEKGLTSGATAPISSERLSSINTQLALAETSRSEAAGILAAVRNGGNDAAASLPAVLENRAVADVKQRLAAAEEQAAAGAIALGPRHPRLRAMQSQVEALRISLDREVGNVVNGARKQFDAAERTVASLKAEMQTAKTDVSLASRDETSIEQMVRDLGVKRNQYTLLTDQRKGLESEQRALLGSTRLVSLAEFPDRRFFPRTTPFLAGGFALALILASASAVLWDRVGAIGRDIGRAPANDLPEPVASLPYIRLRSKGQTGMADILAEGENDPAMRAALRTILGRLGAQVRSVTVLSAFVNEGKTVTTMALARFAALSGKRVLVVEADMRQPALASLLGIDNPVSFADVLSARVTPQQAVRTTSFTNIDAIVSGTAGNWPGDYLTGDRVAAFLDWASFYDLVLIDGPALDQQMDAGLLARRTDGFLFCVAGEQEQLPAMAPVSRRLTKIGASFLGFVLTPPASEAETTSGGFIQRMRSAVGVP